MAKTEPTDKAIVPASPDAPLATVPRFSIEAILQSALREGLPAAEVREIHELYRTVRADQAKEDYNEAFAAFQAEAEPPPRSGKADEKTDGGTRIKFSYSTLGDLDKVLPLFRQHGFIRTFGDVEMEGAFLTLECTFAHKNGHSETRKGRMPTASKFLRDAQNQVVGANSRLRRLVFSNMLGLPTSDLDDTGLPEETPVETITDEQAHGLNDLIIEAMDGQKEKVEECTARLLKKCGVETLGAIAASELADVTAKLQGIVDADRKDGT